VGVQEVRWEGGGTEPVGEYTFFYLGEVGCGDVDWIGLAKDRNRWRAVVSSLLNLRVPCNAGKLSSGLAIGGLSSHFQLLRFS
jgi:hypothetical protein